MPAVPFAEMTLREAGAAPPIRLLPPLRKRPALPLATGAPEGSRPIQQPSTTLAEPFTETGPCEKRVRLKPRRVEPLFVTVRARKVEFAPSSWMRSTALLFDASVFTDA